LASSSRPPLVLVLTTGPETPPAAAMPLLCCRWLWL
jgi:hypothetical protein